MPMTDKTHPAFSAKRKISAKTKPDVTSSTAVVAWSTKHLAEAIKSGHVAGAGFDVFESSPPRKPAVWPAQRRLHAALGRIILKAQENVAFRSPSRCRTIWSSAVSNAINMPSITAEEAPI